MFSFRDLPCPSTESGEAEGDDDDVFVARFTTKPRAKHERIQRLYSPRSPWTLGSPVPTPVLSLNAWKR